MTGPLRPGDSGPPHEQEDPRPPPSTALPTEDRSAAILGVLLVGLAAAIVLRTWRPLAVRD